MLLDLSVLQSIQFHGDLVIQGLEDNKVSFFFNLFSHLLFVYNYMYWSDLLQFSISSISTIYLVGPLSMVLNNPSLNPICLWEQKINFGKKINKKIGWLRSFSWSVLLSPGLITVLRRTWGFEVDGWTVRRSKCKSNTTIFIWGVVKEINRSGIGSDLMWKDTFVCLSITSGCC